MNLFKFNSDHNLTLISPPVVRRYLWGLFFTRVLQKPNRPFALAVEEPSQKNAYDIDKTYGQGPPPKIFDPPFGPEDNGHNGQPDQPVGNSFLAMLLFIGADIMFFTGLIGAFIIFRFGSQAWPPAGQPRLPIAVTGLNTAILLGSGITMIRTWKLLSRRNRGKIIKGLAVTATLGAIFLLVQGVEWFRLLEFGLTLSSGVYGATFYIIIGCHALHVIGALVWLLVVLLKGIRDQSYFVDHHNVGVKLIGMYWLLVVALWPFLYGLVYLT